MLEINLPKYQYALQVCKEKTDRYMRLLTLVREKADALQKTQEFEDREMMAVYSLGSSMMESAETLRRFLDALETTEQALIKAAKASEEVLETGRTETRIGMRSVSLEYLKKLMSDIRFRDGVDENA